MIRDFSKWQCPQCGAQKGDSYHERGRTCTECGYNGDWIQPNEIMTFAENKARLGVESLGEFLRGFSTVELESILNSNR